MDTTGLFITRKRKKWKFAHFDEWPNCFQATQVEPAQWKQPLLVEVGAGTAHLSVEIARRHPKTNVVAIDVKADRLYTGAKVALQEKLENIAFVRAHMAQVDQLFAPHSITSLWVTFPDPYPKKRQAKHRLLHPNFLQQYQKLLTPNGRLYFKSDNRHLFLWSLEQLVTAGWQLEELSFDLHDSNLSDEYKITTTFERRFLAQDIPINMVTCRPPRA